jgi:hypothetical protein
MEALLLLLLLIHHLISLSFSSFSSECHPPYLCQVIIITGSGDKAFAAGADIKELASVSYADVRTVWGQGRGTAVVCRR